MEPRCYLCALDVAYARRVRWRERGASWLGLARAGINLGAVGSVASMLAALGIGATLERAALVWRVLCGLCMLAFVVGAVTVVVTALTALCAGVAGVLIIAASAWPIRRERRPIPLGPHAYRTWFGRAGVCARHAAPASDATDRR